MSSSIRFWLAPFVLLVVGCAAGATERDAVCERAPGIESAVGRIGELAGDVKGMNAAVLRNQLDEDLAILAAALDVAPQRIAGDLSTTLDRLRSLYGSLELLDWDAARFVGDERLASELARLGSVNTRRHLARINDYVVDACSEEKTGLTAPPDSVVATIAPSTSVAVVNDEPIPADENLLTTHVAMGTAIAESFGIEVTVKEAECLGREADLVAIDPAIADPSLWDSAYRSIFGRCGVNAQDRQEP